MLHDRISIIWDALLLFWKTSHLPVLGRGWTGRNTNRHGRRLFVLTESFGEVPDLSPKPFQRKG